MNSDKGIFRLFFHPGVRNALWGVVLLCIVSGCATEDRIAERNVRIRYINLSILFDYMVSTDAEARQVRKQRKEILSALDTIERSLMTEPDMQKRKSLAVKRKDYGEQMRALRVREEYYKRKFLLNMNRAIDEVAVRMRIDYVFNIGEGLVYSRKDFDVTEQVLQELRKVKKRNEPQSR
ncbi:MAG TPA: OmpH family outer membrane protein [Spirochaetota bacterium]|nr:OmpH family outer membrane protein [Spirochaetota bacterium]